MTAKVTVEEVMNCDSLPGSNTSDSNAMGIWVADDEGIKGKLVEITADRTTRQFASRGEISFGVKVSGNAFSGTARCHFLRCGGKTN